MPAAWGDFIQKVSDKLANQGIGGNKDLAEFIADQYCSAIVNKAQSPFGNTHQQGNKSILVDAFKEGLDKLFQSKSPSFEQKEKDPMYADLKESLTSPSDSDYDPDQEFLKWIEENKETNPNYTYFQFFEDTKKYPETIEAAIPMLVKRLLLMDDGSDNFRFWTETLPLGSYKTIGKKVYDEYLKIVKIQKPEEKNGVLVRAVAYKPALRYTQNLINSFRTDPNDYRFLTGREKELNFKISQNSINIDDIGINWDDRWKYEVDPDVITGRLIVKSVQNPKINSSIKYYFIEYQRENSKVNREIDPKTLVYLVEPSELKKVKSGIELNSKLYQKENQDDPNRVPKYMVPSFIAKFTYSPNYDKENSYKKYNQWDLNYNLYLNSNISNNNFSISTVINKNVNGILDSKIQEYGTFFQGEKKKFFDQQIKWSESLKEESKKENATDPQAEEEKEDPFQIMAKGVLDYWKSTGSQPLSANPPISPCVITSPQGGIYTPVYYGSQTKLAKYLKRAWNTGKTLKIPGLQKQASVLVATALAVSFAYHLVELKFVYLGGIPTSNGPVPMVGFCPTVF